MRFPDGLGARVGQQRRHLDTLAWRTSNPSRTPSPRIPRTDVGMVLQDEQTESPYTGLHPVVVEFEDTPYGVWLVTGSINVGDPVGTEYATLGIMTSDPQGSLIDIENLNFPVVNTVATVTAALVGMNPRVQGDYGQNASALSVYIRAVLVATLEEPSG